MDENRLTELGKGNLLRVDGMQAEQRMLGCAVLRPMLHARKAELLRLAAVFRLPYMRDLLPQRTPMFIFNINHWRKINESS